MTIDIISILITYHYEPVLKLLLLIITVQPFSYGLVWLCKEPYVWLHEWQIRETVLVLVDVRGTLRNRFHGTSPKCVFSLGQMTCYMTVVDACANIGQSDPRYLWLSSHLQRCMSLKFSQRVVSAQWVCS